MCVAAGAAPAAAAAATGGTAAPLPPFSLRVPKAGVVRRPLRIWGEAASPAGERIVIEDRPLANGRWQLAAVAVVEKGGAFRTRWQVDRPGRYLLRARPAGGLVASERQAPHAAVAIYLRVRASYYGPGFYGNLTACGQRLTPHTLGVASPTLPCGTLVSFSYHGRSVTVPVIDRGPFVRGISFDLTAATARRLGVRETVPLLALPLAAPARSPSEGAAERRLPARQTETVPPPPPAGGGLAPPWQQQGHR